MDRIGRSLPRTVKETAEGGLALTKTGKEISKRVFG
jgi:L-serine dehydratase